MRLLEIPPSLDRGEITDKGSINQSAVLARRSAIVDALYDSCLPDSQVILARGMND
jgi:feruloyl-CoA synthase